MKYIPRKKKGGGGIFHQSRLFCKKSFIISDYSIKIKKENSSNEPTTDTQKEKKNLTEIITGKKARHIYLFLLFLNRYRKTNNNKTEIHTFFGLTPLSIGKKKSKIKIATWCCPEDRTGLRLRVIVWLTPDPPSSKVISSARVGDSSTQPPSRCNGETGYT